MARALRIERGGSRYDITARGNERKAIFPTTLTALDSAVVSNAVARVARRLTTNTALAKQLVVIQHQWSKCRDLTLIP